MAVEVPTRKWYSPRALAHFVFFRLIPFLLLIATTWSAVLLFGAIRANYSQTSQFESRQSFYSQTATAIAPDQDQGSLGVIRLMQFATNTPEAGSSMPTQQGDNSAFPTNTPNVTPMPPTATDAPTEVPVARTPVALPTFFIPSDPELEQIAGTAVPTRVPVIPRDYELINILLLGDDGEITGGNTVRTDTMIIVSINTETESVSMLSLPRDLFVYVPTPTMMRLNTVYGTGEIFGWSGGGFGLMRETIFYNFGIQVHYHARVNLSALRQIIDTLGGVDLAVDCAYQDYALIGADVPAAAELTNAEDLLYTLPVGYYHFTGGEALWYARTRNLTSDFDRGRRQQRLLRAMFRAARDNGQLADLPNLWGQLTDIVETDIPFDVVLGLLPIARNLDSSRIENFTMIRTYHTSPWQPPSGDFAGQAVQLPVYEPIHDLLVDFYQPPTSSQLEVSGPSVAVYNGTPYENWDRVASERLRTVGINAYAAGNADTQDVVDTRLTDYAALDKGSPLSLIQSELNIHSSNIATEPNPARTVDYEVIVGTNYSSCAGDVLQAEQN